jgi:hypothetical protein
VSRGRERGPEKQNRHHHHRRQRQSDTTWCPPPRRESLPLERSRVGRWTGAGGEEPLLHPRLALEGQADGSVTFPQETGELAQLLALGLTGRALGQMRLDLRGPKGIDLTFPKRLQLCQIGTIH